MTSLCERGNTTGEMGTLGESRDSFQVQDAMGHLSESENGMKCGYYIFKLHEIQGEG